LPRVATAPTRSLEGEGATASARSFSGGLTRL
jgi:hypothetical protein